MISWKTRVGGNIFLIANDDGSEGEDVNKI
jgi:hypothetical protein